MHLAPRHWAVGNASPEMLISFRYATGPCAGSHPAAGEPLPPRCWQPTSTLWRSSRKRIARWPIRQRGGRGQPWSR